MRAEGNKLFYSWNDIHEACERMVEDLGDWRPDIIMPITRGGLIPGVMLSHLMNIKQVSPITIQTRDGSEGHVDPYWQVACATLRDTKVLVVDDIVDSGKTVELMLNYNPQDNIRFSAITLNLDCDVADKVNFLTGYHIDKGSSPDLWIVFPWEN